MCVPVLSCVAQEMRGLQEHIYFGRLDDEQSVVESLLEMHQSVGRWNPRVLGVGDSSSSEADAQTVCVCLCVGGAGRGDVLLGICACSEALLIWACQCMGRHVHAHAHAQEPPLHAHHLCRQRIDDVVIHTMPCSPGWLNQRCRLSYAG